MATFEEAQLDYDNRLPDDDIPDDEEYRMTSIPKMTTMIGMTMITVMIGTKKKTKNNWNFDGYK